MPPATVTGANNGLHLSGSIVQMGGALNQNTDIETPGYSLTVNSAEPSNTGFLKIGTPDAQFGYTELANHQTYLSLVDKFAEFLVSQGSTPTAIMTVGLALLNVYALINSNTKAFLQADGSGNITNVDASAALAGAFIDNQTTLQNPGSYNIQGKGTISNTFTDTIAGALVQYLQNVVNWNAGGSPSSGTLYAASFVNMMQSFNENLTVGNSVVMDALFSRLELLSNASAAVTVSQGTSGGKRALSSMGAEVYLPSRAAG